MTFKSISPEKRTKEILIQAINLHCGLHLANCDFPALPLSTAKQGILKIESKNLI